MSDLPPPMAASCTQCGGHVAITLAGPPISCPYCGNDTPLLADIAARVDELRARVARRAAQDQHLVGRQTHLGEVYGGFFLVAMLIILAVLGVPSVFAMDLPEGMSAVDFLSQPIPAPDEWGELGPNFYWWYLYTLIVFAGLITLYWSATQFRLRRIVRFTYPDRPIASGHPPRCRVCAGELPSVGTVRQCPSCTADHIVTGERYQRAQSSLEAALDAHATQIGTSIAEREKEIEGFTGFAAAGSLGAIVVAGAAGVLAGDTRPVLWSIAAGLLGLAAIIVILARWWYPAPKIRWMYALVPGDRVSVRGTVFPVAAVLKPETAYGQAADYLALLGDAATPVLAIGYQYDGGGQFSARGYGVASGGAGLEPKATLAAYHSKPGSCAPVPGDAPVWVMSRNADIRLWCPEPTPGVEPLYTLEPNDVSSADVFLLDANT